MQRRRQPAIDPRIAPEQGITKEGQPLSYNRAPVDDLAPWVARLYVTKVDLPADYTLDCGLFNDTACVRIQLAGAWTAQTATGPEAFDREALFFGPQTRRMPVSVTGSFISLGMALRPGACTVLYGVRIAELLDRMVPTDQMGRPSEQILWRFDPEATPEHWLATLEQMMRQRVEHAGGRVPDPIAARFEEISMRDPGMAIGRAAEECGVDRRKLERVVKRDFGMAPKQVLRRARALDMASHLRGVADASEANDIALRYYDESHLIHEFTELFGMSPRQFVERPQPIMTLALESRQARRLEALNRIAPGESRPWE
ncbi:helix-turn-helix domain-containing protein [Novosphingobium sp. Leaf2]|uniref:helix-turn-helix domain-containing protein n=1 Tax=Novosphingobium sp. Leaf2 TaxID=1735670 RepID=UPI0006FC859A|nr:helix-turn-helix domain-containing protein [Novosphingobium sp. Leaf2]KQM20290.1 AraC family transcriptional regulator [Novosphingobium sp. Leaf2]